MEKIGDFAKRCQTTIKTLRYYDQLGLLVPDVIDHFTQYRYYGSGKIEEMRRITELKNIGFTLDEIKRFCEATAEEQQRIIEEKHWFLTKTAEETARRLAQLEQIKINLLCDNTVDAPMITDFENDEQVIGRWEFVTTGESAFTELYFLPGGTTYWCFGWTKGYLKVFPGGADGFMVPYTVEKRGDGLYMTLENPDGAGYWTLRQVDNCAYIVYDIGAWDDINQPFVDDPAVYGLWTSVDFVREKNDFNPHVRAAPYLWLKSMEFSPNGTVTQVSGDEEPHVQTVKWTKGKTLEHYPGKEAGRGTITPAYEIRTINGSDYLFFEWKSGDVVWGKWKPQYYVFKRETGGHNHEKDV